MLRKEPERAVGYLDEQFDTGKSQNVKTGRTEIVNGKR